MALKECTKKEEANTYELTVEVDGETFERAVNTVYKKQVKNINIQGFRKGKAPRRIIEKMYGSEVFYEDAMQDCYPDALYEAAKEKDLKIVSVNSLEAVEAGKDGFTFKTVIVVEPTLDIDGYKGFEIEKKSTEVTEELVDEGINKVRERNSRLVEVEGRAAKKGDTAVIDFEGFVDGEAFEGGKAEGYSLALGSGNFIPGCEEEVEGHEVGEEFTITVNFPDDYQAENLKGKEAQFKIKLHELKEKELPKVDDDFVKDVSDKDTLDEYKEELKTEIEGRLKDEAQKDIDDQIATKLIDLAQGDIPEAMYENQVNEMMRDFEMRLRQQGMNIDMKTYMQYMGMEESTVREMYREEAEKKVKLRLALQAIAVKENVEVTDADIEDEYSKMAEAYKMDVAQVKAAIPADSLTEDIKVQKALDIVKNSAVIK